MGLVNIDAACHVPALPLGARIGSERLRAAMPPVTEPELKVHGTLGAFFVRITALATTAHEEVVGGFTFSVEDERVPSRDR